jgi:hypothetical protein
MADEPQVQEHEQDEQQEKEDHRIPKSRFDEVNNRAKEAERRAKELEDRLLQFEDRDKSEVERERDARIRAESLAQQMADRVTSLEKGSWVRSAATELNFHDPEDAMYLLKEELGGLEDERDARKRVERIAKSKKHLVREEKKQAEPPRIGALFSGQAVPAGQGANSRPKSEVELAREAELQQASAIRDELGQFLNQWKKY